ncbi:MAG: MarR family winged helix-turn-helix transcriptional regulator [Bulleidia sp.]
MNERFEKFTVSISRIERAIRRIENFEMAEYNLRSSHISCLYFLYTTDARTASELTLRCNDDKATISRSLEYLEKNGYVHREKSVRKRYNTPVVLTEKGNAAAASIAEKIHHVLQEVSFDITDEQREILYTCLFNIADRLETILDNIEKGQAL